MLTSALPRHKGPFMLSVANMNVENTNSSQFFITLAPTPDLDGRHTCFGKVLVGYGVLRQVRAHIQSLTA